MYLSGDVRTGTEATVSVAILNLKLIQNKGKGDEIWNCKQKIK